MEIPDNWRWHSQYNLPLDEMMQVVDHALDNGYTIEWAADVSELGFDRIKAIGIIPEDDVESMEGTEAERWGKLSAAERQKALYSFEKPIREKSITQQMRQTAFDNYQTTDDHGMQIVGYATDQTGKRFYKVKNSWDVRPLRRLLLLLTSVRRVQNHVDPGQQKFDPQTHKKEAGIVVAYDSQNDPPCRTRFR